MNNNIVNRFTLTTLFLILLVCTLAANPEEAAAATTDTTWIDWAYQNLLLVIGGLTILGAISSLFYLNNQLMELTRVRVLQEHGLEVAKELSIAQAEPAWKRLYKRMTKVVPIEKEADVMLDHNYDGIRELDNILPPWWVGMFYASIVVGVLYFGYYHVTDYGLSSGEAYALEMEEAEDAVKAYLAMQADRVDETTVEALVGENELALGATIFTNKCATCHGMEGQGGVGPNLTDKYWLHGGDIKDVFKTVKYGVPEKGMIAWKAQLRAGDIQKVSSYILTLVGTNPVDGKAPEGDLYEPATTTNNEPTNNEQLGMNQ